jgi:hypothetical protein
MATHIVFVTEMRVFVYIFMTLFNGHYLERGGDSLRNVDLILSLYKINEM